MSAVPFYKYSGCGNDFILIEESHLTAVALRPYVTSLCHRWEGIGADGILLLDKNAAQGAYVRIFNADGSEAAFCGNGLRCVARHLHALGGAATYTLETLSGLYQARVDPDGSVEISMGDIPALQGPYPPAQDTAFPMYSVVVGVPHAVVICPQIANLDVAQEGRKLRHSPLFAPEGANINFITRLDTNNIAIRTYERGVEAETLACGSGAAAAALIAAYHWDIASPLCLHTRHGATLHYTFLLDEKTARHLTMRGPTHLCFQGSFSIPHTALESNTIVDDTPYYLQTSLLTL